jgi:hypothetical protein
MRTRCDLQQWSLLLFVAGRFRHHLQ